MTNTTISRNSASDAGGIWNCGTLTLTNSTVSGNTASAVGGGIYNEGSLTLNHATLNHNSAPNGANVAGITGSSVSMRATIVANPLGGGANCGGGGTITSQGFNLEFPGASCGSPEVTAGPKLAPLANNGGRTLTHALQPGSAAIDKITSNCPPPATDQRGVARPKDGDKNGSNLCDIGAYERSDTTPPRSTLRTPLPTRRGWRATPTSRPPSLRR